MQRQRNSMRMQQIEQKTINDDLTIKSTKSVKRRRKGQMRQQTILQIRKDLFERFQQFNIAQSFTKIYNMFRKSIGRHSPTSYQPSYNFKEQWQVSNKFQNKQQYKTDSLYGFINFIILLAINLCIFLVSVKVFFEIQNSQWIYYLIISLCFLSILKTIGIIKKISLKERWQMITKELICLIISTVLCFTENLVDYVSILGVVIIVLLYLKSCKMYRHIKIFTLSSKYRQVVQIFDLFVLLLAISHIFALLIYGTTKLHPEENWMTKIKFQDETWHTKYIYSLYFSCTTLLTVGYGDISPTNVAEILTILVAQFFGIATFAYAVNKIGVALSNISQRAQKLQKDLGNVEHIGNEYRLRPQLICRMRTELVKDKKLDEEINIVEESELFSKFSEDLRESKPYIILGISIESSMRVIKRSMFMIGNWTGKLQSKIARKLVKQIYGIDQILPQSQGKQKIYILDKGKIDVINNAKLGFKVCFQKVLKTMSVQSNTEVLVENVYGYSFVISERNIHLNAIAKSNSICYSLSKSDLYELLAESQQDLQHFHELKTKIELSKIPQEIEAPSIINFRQHYCPSVHYIIASYYYKQNQNNERISALRRKRRMNLICNAQNFSEGTLLLKRSKTGGSLVRNSLFKEELFSVSKFNEVQEEKAQEYYRDYDENDLREIQGFQACKQYQRYYKKSNYDQVLKRMKTKISRPSFKFLINAS